MLLFVSGLAFVVHAASGNAVKKNWLREQRSLGERILSNEEKGEW